MDQLVLDPQVLRNAADLIRMYCQHQKGILDNYVSGIQTLGTEWQDDETFYTMFCEIMELCRRSEQYFDDISVTFPAEFLRKAELLEQRPSFDKGVNFDVSYGGMSTSLCGTSVSTDADSTGRTVIGARTLKQRKWKLTFGLKRKSAMLADGISLKKDPIKPGQYYCAGDHYAEFLDYWLNLGKGKYVTVDVQEPEQIKTVYVRARDIEGVYLNKNEVESPSGFWTRQGVQDYSKDMIFKKASLVSRVKSCLEAGISRYELSEDPELGSTYGSYFSNPIMVRELGNFYVFATDGRHRTIAAQSLDQYIPVQVIGKIARKY